MSAYRLPIIFLTAVSVVCAAHAQKINTDYWHPDTSMLDEIAKHGPSSMRNLASTFLHDMKRFYQLLRDKQWHEAYQLRAKAFREVVLEPYYLAEAKKADKYWGLVNYDVLDCTFQNDDGTNDDVAIVICKFTELPGYDVSYATVFWHKEEGVWRCLSAGPRKLDIFMGTRPPTIDWK